MKVSAVIPAHNEQERIADVLDVVVGCSKLNEVIVVDDGSKDDTFKVAKRFPGVKVESLGSNKGKTQAMNRGVEVAKSPHILFLDADLKGLEESHIEKMIDKYQDCEMVIGIFHKGKWHTDLSQKIFSSHLSGQRILSEQTWNNLNLNKVGEFGAEMALFKMNLSVREVKLEGLTHVLKEEKMGFLNGLQARLKMYFHVVKAFLFK